MKTRALLCRCSKVFATSGSIKKHNCLVKFIINIISNILKTILIYVIPNACFNISFASLLLLSLSFISLTSST